ncbi:hypothetical protein V3F56_09095 [Moorellaceae bacterium AZ2]
MEKYPPDTEDLQALADFFDRTDITELEGLELIVRKPHRQNLADAERVSSPREDMED